MRALRRSLLIRLQELSGLVAEWGDFFICDNTVKIKAKHAVDVMATCDIIIAVCNKLTWGQEFCEVISPAVLFLLMRHEYLTLLCTA